MKKALRVLINSQKDYGEVVSITDGYCDTLELTGNFTAVRAVAHTSATTELLVLIVQEQALQILLQ